MFTGIIVETGLVKSFNNNGLLNIEAKKVLDGLSIGDSVAVNGCCLTVVELDNSSFRVQVVEETLRCTSLGELAESDLVNLERPLCFQGRIDGHFVQGHVDDIGSILSKQQNSDGSTLVTIVAPPSITRYIVEKGSIAVDGVSLTAFSVKDDQFSFVMIPHTAKETSLGWKKIGAKVNLEADMLAKHIEKFGRLGK